MPEPLVLKPEPTLSDIQKYVADMVEQRGFKNDISVIPQRFMLLLEECGEFARASRKIAGIKHSPDTHAADLQDEAADILIVLVGICNLLDIDLEKAFRVKEQKNSQRVWS